MKKNQVLIVQKLTGDQTLEVGAKLLGPDEKETDIVVKKITVFFKTAKAYFSDGRVFIFKGFPFLIIKK